MWRAQCGVTFRHAGVFSGGGGRGCYCHGLLTVTWSAYCSNPLSKLHRNAKNTQELCCADGNVLKTSLCEHVDGAYWHFCPRPRYSPPVGIHLELASHDNAPSDPRIQLYHQPSLFCFHIPPLSLTVSPHEEFIVFWFDADLDGEWPRLTSQRCGALGAVVQWWRRLRGSHQGWCSLKGCTVSSPSSALTGDWIHQLIIKPQISNVFWISWVGKVEQMTLLDRGCTVLFKSVAILVALCSSADATVRLKQSTAVKCFTKTAA